MWPWLQSILSVDESGFWLHSIMLFQKKEFDKSSGLWELFPARFDFKISCFAEKQGIFISEMKWPPFMCLFWKANDSVVKLIVTITSAVSLWCRPYCKNILNYENDNIYRNLATI